MIHDLAIRGGTLIDGTGAPGVPADIGISRGVVAEIASTVRGRHEMDASGRLVAPVAEHGRPSVSYWLVPLRPDARRTIRIAYDWLLSQTNFIG